LAHSQGAAGAVEGVDRSEQRCGELLLRGGGRGALIHRFGGWIGDHMAAANLLAAPPRDRHVERDPVQPGREPGAVVEAREGSPGLQQDLLLEVLPIARRPTPRQRHPGRDATVLVAVAQEGVGKGVAHGAR